MIAAKLDPEFENRVTQAAKALGLTVTQLVRTGLRRVLEEYQATGAVVMSEEPAETEHAANEA